MDEPAPHRRTPSRPIVALVLAILAFIIWPLGLLFAIPAVLLGHAAKADIERNPDLEGSGFAVGALVVGYAYLAAAAIFILLIVFLFTAGYGLSFG